MLKGCNNEQRIFHDSTSIGRYLGCYFGSISSGSLGNSAIIDLGDLTVVVDTTNLPHSGALLRHTAEELTNKPVKYVVNTHFHGDHVNGNQEFMKSEFISTVWTRDLLSDMGEVNIDLMQQNIQKIITSLNHVRSTQRDAHMLTEIDYDLSVQRALYDAIPSLCRVIPTITFDDKLVIQGTKRTIEVLSYGGGHSLSDAVVYVPEEQTLIAGDLISTKTIPVIPYGNPYAWIRILKRIQKTSRSILSFRDTEMYLIQIESRMSYAFWRKRSLMFLEL